MELTAEELKLIQDRRDIAAKKAEAELLAARSAKEKALDVFTTFAKKQNDIANDLIASIKSKNKDVVFNAYHSKDIIYHDKIDGESVSSNDVGFTDFGPGLLDVTDAFGNVVTIRLDSRKNSFRTDYAKYSIQSDCTINSRYYKGDVAANAAAIVLKRLDEYRDLQVRNELRKQKRETAEAYLQKEFPKAKIRISFNDYGGVTYTASEFEGVYEFTSISGDVKFKDLKVVSYSRAISSFSKKSEKDIKIDALQTEMIEKINELKNTYMNAFVEVLNG